MHKLPDLLFGKIKEDASQTHNLGWSRVFLTVGWTLYYFWGRANLFEPHRLYISVDTEAMYEAGLRALEKRHDN